MAQFDQTDLGIWQNGCQSTYPFFMYEKVWFRLETTEPVTEFYIDWDDGDDNSSEKANIEHVILDEPSFFCVSSHVYTSHGSFYPLVRVKSTDGYLSKWYTAYEDEGSFRTTLDTSGEDPTTQITSDDTTIKVDSASALGGIVAGDTIRIDEEYMYVSNVATNDLTVVRASVNGTDVVGQGQIHIDGSLVYKAAKTNQNDYSALEPATLGSGQNEYSLVSIDNIQDHRLPVYRPANKPPMGVLKTDRNRILSGINNEVLGGAVSTVEVDGSDCSSDDVKVKITYIKGGSTDSQILEVTKIDTESITNVEKVLRVEILNHKEVTNTTAQSLKAGERIYIRKTDENGPALCNVSLGNPIVEVSNPNNIANLDLSESRTRASNVSISEFYIDDGHHITGSSRWAITDALQQEAVTTTATQDSLQTSDTLHASFRTYYPSIEAQHTFQPETDPLGTDGRYLSKEILCRGQVKDSSSTTRVDSGNYMSVSNLSGDTIEYSYIDHDDYVNYYTTTKPRPTSLKSSNVLLRTLNRASPDWANMKVPNRKAGNNLLLGGGHAGASTRIIPGGTDYEADAENFFLMARKDKFDRIFLKTYNNYTKNTIPTLDRSTVDNSTVPPYRISIFYPSKNRAGQIIWKPLPFKDTSAYENIEASSLMRDGSISFKPPKDWESAKHGDIHEWPFGADFGEDNDTTYGENEGPDDLWDTDQSYALMIAMATDNNIGSTNEKNIGLQFMKPYTNNHSQLLTMVDSTYVSLNNNYLTQSISFVRDGIYNIITNKLGKAEIRKIGAKSGSIKFGGTDLSGETSRKVFKEYQQNGTPVYLDVEHKNGDFTRFFGVIKSMSESHATGGMLPKFSLSMIVSHIIEFDSSGTMLSRDYISLGGNVDYESKYLQ